MKNKFKTLLAVCMAICVVVCIMVGCTKNESVQNGETLLPNESKSETNMGYTLSFVHNGISYEILGNLGDGCYTLKKVPSNVAEVYNENQCTINHFVYIDSTGVSVAPIDDGSVSVYYDDFTSGALDFKMTGIRSLNDTVWFNMSVNGSVINSYKIYGNEGFAELFLNELFANGSAKSAPLVLYSGSAIRLVGIATVIVMNHNTVPYLPQDEERAYWCIKNMEVNARECMATGGNPNIVHSIHHACCKFECNHPF